MTDINDFVQLSKYAGERFDLVQAAGGNTSVKLDNGLMYIKASGFTLSEVEKNNGFAKVNTKKIQEILSDDTIILNTDKKQREETSIKLVHDAIEPNSLRPSIETLLHAILLKHTLHTHPIVYNIISIQKNWITQLQHIFSSQQFICIDYFTPGIDLAIALKKEIDKLKSIPQIIFLQNHGMIISGNTINEVIALNEMVIDKIEKHLNFFFNPYKLTNKISTLINKQFDTKLIAYLCGDENLNNLIIKHKNIFIHSPFTPDGLVYCGINALEVYDIESDSAIQDYVIQNKTLPKIIIYKSYIYFIAQNIKKAKELEEVFKSNILILEHINLQEIHYLSPEEIHYLNNWEAEKFRQNL